MNHQFYMKRCLELAEKGMSHTSPNPLVGALIVHNKLIIGEGYHQEFGGPHAEVNAINSVSDKSLLKESTIYVSLEPCSHFGKTPPCAHLIIDSGIPEVVICNKDPHEKVAGKGIKLLKEHGIKVISGVLEAQGEWLNRRFFKYHRSQVPYVILKWAENQSGFIDKLRTDKEEGINWITQLETKSLVHLWRAQEDAILIGANTVLNDAPSLNVRHSFGKNPLRIVLDPNSKVPDDHSFWKLNTPTIVFSMKERKINSWTIFHKLFSKENILTDILEKLAQLNVLSVIIEGGAFTLNSFIDQNYWDEARILIGKNKWENGLKSPSVAGHLISKHQFTFDQVKILTKEKNL